MKQIFLNVPKSTIYSKIKQYLNLIQRDSYFHSSQTENKGIVAVNDFLQRILYSDFY